MSPTRNVQKQTASRPRLTIRLAPNNNQVQRRRFMIVTSQGIHNHNKTIIIPGIPGLSHTALVTFEVNIRAETFRIGRFNRYKILEADIQIHESGLLPTACFHVDHREGRWSGYQVCCSDGNAPHQPVNQAALVVMLAWGWRDAKRRAFGCLNGRLYVEAFRHAMLGLLDWDDHMRDTLLHMVRHNAPADVIDWLSELHIKGKVTDAVQTVGRFDLAEQRAKHAADVEAAQRLLRLCEEA